MCAGREAWGVVDGLEGLGDGGMVWVGLGLGCIWLGLAGFDSSYRWTGLLSPQSE